MQEKGQITKHEWERHYKWFYKCPHCECVKIIPDLGKVTYHMKGVKESTTQEPACITRYPEQEAGKNEE